ncbi:MAG: hypothetical protein ND866_31525, partial [Pyrinomonadaceae bacterium]|nr:hypothetical protein [Pyrinomonadaceae bacterium]
HRLKRRGKIKARKRRTDHFSFGIFHFSFAICRTKTEAQTDSRTSGESVFSFQWQMGNGKCQMENELCSYYS